MKEGTQAALVSGVTSIVAAIITALATIAASGINEQADKAVETANEAKTLAENSLTEPCKIDPERSSDHTRTYDLSSIRGKLVFISANARGSLDEGGGGRVVLRAEIYVANDLKARDSDFRSGGNLDNERDWGASAVHLFQVRKNTPTATVKISAYDPRNALRMDSEITCMEINMKET